MAVNCDDHVDHLDHRRYDGETEQRRLELETATIVVTSHRVLTVDRSGHGTPGAKPYRHADRPNVQHVGITDGGSPKRLLWSLLAGALGLTLLTIAAVVSFAELVPEIELDGTAAAGEDGGGAGAETDIGGTGGETGTADGTTAAVDGTFDTLGVLFQLLDLAILVGGLLSLAIGAVVAGLYVRSRSRRLVVAVAGADDIAVPLGETDDAGPITLSLSEAIEPGPTPAAGVRGGTDEFSRPATFGEPPPRGERGRGHGGRDESG